MDFFGGSYSSFEQLRGGELYKYQEKKRDKMPIFVILENFTQKRMETIKGLPESLKEGSKILESFGVKIRELVFTMGRYDLVAIVEAPDAEASSKAFLSWGSKGLIRTESLT